VSPAASLGEPPITRVMSHDPDAGEAPAAGGAMQIRPTTRRVQTLVEGRRPAALALGRHVAELVQDPEALARELSAGLADLGDPEYLAGQRRVAPGIGDLHGVRSPLLHAVGREFARATEVDPPSLLLLVADRLLRAPTLEERWLAFGILERTLARDPERSWQLLRRAGRQAADWITVEGRARAGGRGGQAAPHRGAAREQLVFSPSRWERRLVGSTIAGLPFVDPRLGRDPAIAGRSLVILGDLMGDREPDVQKALSWALRSLTLVDPAVVEDFCRHEAATALRTSDGHRAWVVRDALSRLSPATALALRTDLTGIRRRPGAPSTSRAAATAARFAAQAGGLDPTDLPEPPL
jgi:hypothetical protein